MSCEGVSPMGPRTSDGKKKPRVRKRAHGEPDAPVYRNRFANLASPEAGWAVPGVTGLCLSDCGWGVGGREGTRLTGAFVSGDVRRHVLPLRLHGSPPDHRRAHWCGMANVVSFGAVWVGWLRVSNFAVGFRCVLSALHLRSWPVGGARWFWAGGR